MEVQSLSSVLHHLAKENYFHKGIVLANLLKRSYDADFGLTLPKSGAFKQRFVCLKLEKFNFVMIAENQIHLSCRLFQFGRPLQH